jgi:hypothetical protein
MPRVLIVTEGRLLRQALSRKRNAFMLKREYEIKSQCSEQVLSEGSEPQQQKRARTLRFPAAVSIHQSAA